MFKCWADLSQYFRIGRPWNVLRECETILWLDGLLAIDVNLGRSRVAYMLSLKESGRKRFMISFFCASRHSS